MLTCCVLIRTLAPLKEQSNYFLLPRIYGGSQIRLKLKIASINLIRLIFHSCAWNELINSRFDRRCLCSLQYQWIHAFQPILIFGRLRSLPKRHTSMIITPVHTTDDCVELRRKWILKKKDSECAYYQCPPQFCYVLLMQKSLNAVLSKARFTLTLRLVEITQCWEPSAY